ncbi:MAG: glucokinase [Pseudomonadota bacterium]
MSNVLVADVGGTSVRFAIGRKTRSGVAIEAFAKRSGDDFTGFEEALCAYIAELKTPPTAACLALAGPVRDGAVTLLNRPQWPPIAKAALQERFKLSRVDLFNDFEAMARGVPLSPETAFFTLAAGDSAPNAPIAVTGPGTGVGVAVLLPQDGGWRVVGGEGGHSAYTPYTDLEWEVVRVLRGAGRTFISNELMLSGAGFDAVRQAVSTVHGAEDSKATPQKIADMAAADDPIALDICRLRARGVMGLAGDLVLTLGARGGAVIAGGVSQHLRAFLQEPAALSRFFERSGRSDYMSGLPIRLLEDPNTPLLGAAALYFEGAAAG